MESDKRRIRGAAEIRYCLPQWDGRAGIIWHSPAQLSGLELEHQLVLNAPLTFYKEGQREPH